MFQEKTAAGPERPSDRAEHASEFVVLEVAERGEPVENAIEPVDPRERAHVALHVLDLDTALGRVLARTVEEQPRRVEARDAGAAGGESVRDAAVPAGEVEHLHSRLELEYPPDHVDLRIGALVAEEGAPEVEVVVAEQALVELGHVARFPR